MTTLIIPCAGKSSRYPGSKPKWLFTHPDGKLMIEKIIYPFTKNPFIKNKILTTTREIEKKFQIKYLINQIYGNKVKVFILNKQTKSASETIYKTIKQFKLTGQILLKDSDSFFSLNSNFNFKDKNFLVGVDLSKHSNISKIHQKSFLRLNNKNQIIDIEEKKIISDKICVGLYSFENAKDFERHFIICSKTIKNKEIYISFIVKSMINADNLFLYTDGLGYEDYGTFDDWLEIRKKYRTLFVDIDGVVFKNKGKYGKKNWSTKNENLKNNIQTLLNLNKKGNQIIFTSARSKENEKKIASQLKKLGFSSFKILTGLYHSQRIIINDYFLTNPCPSALAINIKRDDDNLDQFIKTL